MGSLYSRPGGVLTKLLGVLVFFVAAPLGLDGCTFKSKIEPPHTIHLALEAKIDGLDPVYADDLYAGMQSTQAYEALFQYHYLKRPYTLIPSLAESMPEFSSDGLTLKIHLKKGVLFQDDPSFKSTQGKGREMTADDVVFSFKRLADPKLVSPGWWIFEGKIVGLDEWRAATAKQGSADYSQGVEGLKALDRYTVQLKLTKMSTQFMYYLAMPFTGIVPKEAVEFYGKEFLSHAVGTGPFRLVEFNPNSKIVWERNPTYRKELYPNSGSPGDKEAGLLADAGKPLPLAERLVFQVFVEQQPMWLNFLSGKLDVSGIPKDDFGTAVTPQGELSPDLKAKGIVLTKVPGLDVVHTTFNLEDPILGKNKVLRQAMSLAYDTPTFIELFYNGRAIVAQGPIPPGLDGYDPHLKNPYQQFNVAKAKEFLAKAGYPNGKGLPVFEYAFVASSVSRQIAEYFQKMMSAIGINISMSSYSWPQFLEVVKNKKAQIWSYSWRADYPDAETFLQLFYSKNVAPGPNDSNYSNPEFDRMYEKSLTLSPGTERTALYKAMAELVIADCPWIFEAHRLTYGLNYPWLKNYKPHEFELSRYKYLRIDPNLKK